MNVRTHYPLKSSAEPELGGGPVLVETAGFIPKEVQLQILLDSGEQLEQYRKNMFPNLIPENEVESLEYDPTIEKGYDIFDYHNDVNYVMSNMERKQQEHLRKLTAEKAQSEVAATGVAKTTVPSAVSSTPPANTAGGMGGAGVPPS